MAISGRVALLILVGVAAVIAMPLPVVVVSWLGLVAVLCLADGLLAVRPARLRIVRDLPSSVRLTQTAASRLTLTNPTGRRARVLVRDAWPPSACASGDRQRLALGPGDSARQVVRLTPTRRGDLHAADVTVRSFGPLGLVARQRSVAVEGTLRVLPEFRSRSQLPYRLARLRELDGQAAVHVRGQGTEFDSLREYAHGDDVRSIDWRASARAQKTMVRTWRPERDRHVLLVLDTSRWAAGRLATAAPSGPPARPSVSPWQPRDVVPTGQNPLPVGLGATRLDAGIETCLLMGALAAASGDRVSMLAVDRAVRARVASVHRQGAVIAGFANALSHVEPTLVEADWSLIAAQIDGLCAQRSLVILVTGLDPALWAEGLGLVLPVLAHDHRVVVAHVLDPAETARATDATSVTAAYDAAAVSRLTLATDALTDRVRRFGVDVVRADPDLLAPAVCDKYLQLKATGRL